MLSRSSNKKSLTGRSNLPWKFNKIFRVFRKNSHPKKIYDIIINIQKCEQASTPHGWWPAIRSLTGARQIQYLFCVPLSKQTLKKQRTGIATMPIDEKKRLLQTGVFKNESDTILFLLVKLINSKNGPVGSWTLKEDF